MPAVADHPVGATSSFLVPAEAMGYLAQAGYARGQVGVIGEGFGEIFIYFRYSR